MKKILVTAFGSFGAYRANTTELVARYLQRVQSSDFEFETVIFECLIPPSTVNRGHELNNYVRRANAHAVVSLGMSSEKTGLCIETAAYNAIDSKYCSPEESGRAIDGDSPYDSRLDMDISTWNIPAFLGECDRRGIPRMNTSQNPGRFCCNHLMYQVQALRTNGRFDVPFIFVHVPCSAEAVVDSNAHQNSGKILMPVHEIIKGIHTLAGCLSVGSEKGTT